MTPNFCNTGSHKNLQANSPSTFHRAPPLDAAAWQAGWAQTEANRIGLGQHKKTQMDTRRTSRTHNDRTSGVTQNCAVGWKHTHTGRHKHRLRETILRHHKFCQKPHYIGLWWWYHRFRKNQRKTKKKRRNKGRLYCYFSQMEGKHR